MLFNVLLPAAVAETLWPFCAVPANALPLYCADGAGAGLPLLLPLLPPLMLTLSLLLPLLLHAARPNRTAHNTAVVFITCFFIWELRI